MPNKKYFFDFLLLKIFTGHKLKILVRNLDPKCIDLLQLEKCSIIYSKPDLRLCFDCDARPLRRVFVQLSFVPSPHGTVLAEPPLVYGLHTHDISLKFSNVMARKNL